jgi:hypothetical protein
VPVTGPVSREKFLGNPVGDSASGNAAHFRNIPDRHHLKTFHYFCLSFLVSIIFGKTLED